MWTSSYSDRSFPNRQDLVKSLGSIFADDGEYITLKDGTIVRVYELQ